MFSEIGGLQNYWHIIALSKELKPNKSLRKKIYGVPILIWKDKKKNFSAIIDSCRHKKSPLEVSCFKTNEIVCPYHGWRYDANGNLYEIPSSPHINTPNLNCSLQKFKIIEKQGFIWVNLNPSSELDINAFLQDKNIENNWGNTKLTALFDTSDELLIENFMDATHTPFVHTGLIRGHGKKTKHDIKLSSTAEGLVAEYAETTEEIGLGLNLILGKNLKIKHTDEFILPNFVKVDYYINNKHHFSAFIACTPVSAGKTKAFVSLSYNFRGFNPFIKLIIPYLAKKVIRQDLQITKLQYDNQQLMKNQKELLIDSDIMHNKVRLIIKSVKNDAKVPEINSNFRLTL